APARLLHPRRRRRPRFRDTAVSPARAGGSSPVAAGAARSSASAAHSASPLPADLAHARIAIVMMSAVGDSVHVLPLINALKRVEPTVEITWVLQPLPATLMRGHPQVDRIIEVDPGRGA